MRSGALAIAFLIYAWSASVTAQDLSSVEIPYEKHVLENGLTVILHEDDSAPQASIAVYYKVGSRDERPGRTGFAHLFEHLMFNGSENFHGEYIAAVQAIGGSLNGDTWLDRTRYYQTVPNTALERVLWMESDRMGHLLGAVTQEQLDRQRGVVQNEKRRKENRPYASVWPALMAGLFGDGHPYRWQTIGSMEDLEAASLDDVHAWFKAWYGPANAIIVVAGDIDPAEALHQVRRYFGDIPAGTPVNRADDRVPDRINDTVETIADRVASPMITRGWAVPGSDHEDSTLISLAASILGGDSSSRLYRRLVKEEKLAVSASMELQSFELASVATVNVLLAPGASADEVRRVVDAELARFIADGPTRSELELTKTQLTAEIIMDLDFLFSKAILLAESEFFGGAPDAFRKDFARIDGATRDAVRDAAARWLRTGYHEVHVAVFDEHETVASDVDRSAAPEISGYPDATAPEPRDFTLRNGIPVRFVRREGVPAVNVLGQFRTGRAIGEPEKPEAATMAFDALRKGTRTRSAVDIANDLKRSGSSVRFSMGRDVARFSASTLTSRFDDAMELAADMLRNPSFDKDEVALLIDARVATIGQRKTSPSALANRYVRSVVYGDHPYGGRPATADDVRALTPDDLRSAWARRARSDELSLYVAGDIDTETMLDVLNRHFGDWQSGGGDAAARPDLEAPIPEARGPRIIVFDLPGVAQSNIVAAQVIDSPYREGHDAFSLAASVFGGSFGSRINLNLREEKGWSYGVRSATQQVLGPRLWTITAQVQTDKTAQSIRELITELQGILGDEPVTAEEFDRVRNERIRRLSSSGTTARGIISYLADNELYGRPDEFIEQRKADYESIELDDLAAAMRARIDPGKLAWFVSGDLDVIEHDLRALGIARLEVWDPDGEPVEKTP